MKKALFTLSAATLLASTSLFAVEDSLQQHLQMEQKLQKKYQKRLKDGNGDHNQHTHKHEHQYKYQGTNPNRMNNGSMQSRGGRH